MTGRKIRTILSEIGHTDLITATLNVEQKILQKELEASIERKVCDLLDYLIVLGSTPF